MPFKEKSGFCHHCESQVLARKQVPNHLVHAIVTLFLFGLWLPVWIIASLSKEPWRCTRCGRPVTKSRHEAAPINTTATFAAKCLACGEESEVLASKAGQTIACIHCGAAMPITSRPPI